MSPASAAQRLPDGDATGVAGPPAAARAEGKGLLRVLAQLRISSGELGEEPAGGCREEGGLFISQISPY